MGKAMQLPRVVTAYLRAYPAGNTERGSAIVQYAVLVALLTLVCALGVVVINRWAIGDLDGGG